MSEILGWLRARAAECGDKLAVCCEEDSLSFAQLEELSCQMAQELVLRLELTPAKSLRRCIAFYAEKSTGAFVGLLAAQRLAAAYSFIDVRQTSSRVSAMLHKLEPLCVLVETKAQFEQVKDLGYKVFYLGELCVDYEIDAQLLQQFEAASIDTDPLYISFTSGSTGEPKGVVISRKSVEDFIPHFCEELQLQSDDRLSNQAPFDFDVSVKDIYSCLYLGASLQLIPRPYFSEPAKLMDYLESFRPTSLCWAVSALCFVSIMGALEYKAPLYLKRLMFSGEKMPKKQLLRWQKAVPELDFYNLYGPTEITCNCLFHKLTQAEIDSGELPIGKAFGNERVYLLNEAGDIISPEQPQVEGEICVAGSCLALGYIADAEKTEAAFKQHQFGSPVSERLYHTGDIAYYNEAQDLVFAGRRDHQIKHLGQRIELADIEATAQKLPEIEQSLCLYDEKRKQILLAYVGSLTKEELFTQLRELLPSYMVANKLLKLEAFPLNKNGKIDREAVRALF